MISMFKIDVQKSHEIFKRIYTQNLETMSLTHKKEGYLSASLVHKELNNLATIIGISKDTLNVLIEYSGINKKKMEIGF
jgi:hypothetical protein